VHEDIKTDIVIDCQKSILVRVIMVGKGCVWFFSAPMTDLTIGVYPEASWRFWDSLWLHGIKLNPYMIHDPICPR